MELLPYLMFGWLFSLIPVYEAFEPISFSPTESKSVPTPISYWNGNLTIAKDSSLLEENLNINLYLNKFQGLLFYAIDSKFRTIWMEFVQDVLEISYYNFIIGDIDKRVYKLQTLCNLSGNKISMILSLRAQELSLICNGVPQTMDYMKEDGPISQANFEKFISNMVLPIPMFNNANTSQGNLVYIWIGNTPSPLSPAATKFYNDAILKSNPSFLWGCVRIFSVSNIPLRLATTGQRYGEMISPFCDPVCNSTSCYNNGVCTELWRGRFSCDCGLSQFIGDRCNEEYSVKFEGSRSVEFSQYFRFEKVRFSFQPVIYGDTDVQKILSIKFKTNKYLQIYMDTNDYLHTRFIYKNIIPDVYFKVKIADGQNYTFIIDSDLDNIYLKLADSKMNQIIDQKTIKHNQNNLIIEHILVGDSHSPTMNWMKKYNGCFSNLMLQSDKRKYLWNELPDFHELPKCGSDSKTSTSTESKIAATLKKKSLATNAESSITGERTEADINTSYMTYIAIGVSIFVLLLISVVIIYRCIIRRERRRPVYLDKEKLTLNNETQKPPESIRSSYSIPFTTYSNPKPMTFKPAYKARSMSSSPNARSMISLPMSMTPTLVTPEGEIVQYSDQPPYIVSQINMEVE